MKTYTFQGTVYYMTPTGKKSLETTLTVQAPSQKVAKAIVANYGLQSLRLRFGGQLTVDPPSM